MNCCREGFVASSARTRYRYRGVLGSASSAKPKISQSNTSTDIVQMSFTNELTGKMRMSYYFEIKLVKSRVIPFRFWELARSKHTAMESKRRNKREVVGLTRDDVFLTSHVLTSSQLGGQDLCISSIGRVSPRPLFC